MPKQRIQYDLASLPATGKEGRVLGTRFFFNGKPCQSAHVGPRFSNGGGCLECFRSRAVAYQNAYRKRNRNPHLEYSRVYQARARLEGTDWASQNRDKMHELQRAWRRNNRDKMYAGSARRRANKAQACPAWLTADDHRQIAAKFDLANRLFVETGIHHEVDHIVPLQGKTVTGLHVPWNLQAIPTSVNRQKPRHWNPNSSMAT